MIEPFLKILIVLIFIFISYQDIKSQTISLYSLVGLFLMALTIQMQDPSGFVLSLSDITYNLVFIVVQVALLILYIYLRYNSSPKHLERYIGFGDILFWVVVTPLFTFPSFTYIFIGSLIAALLVHVVLSIPFKQLRDRIPLAGFQSIFLCSAYLSNWLYD